MRGVTHVMLLENEGSTEVGTETALAVAVDLLPGGAILEHTLQSNVVRFLPRRAGVVHVAIGRRLVRVAVELRTLEAHTLVHHAADAVAQLGERRTPGTRGALGTPRTNTTCTHQNESVLGTLPTSCWLQHVPPPPYSPQSSVQEISHNVAQPPTHSTRRTRPHPIP